MTGQPEQPSAQGGQRITPGGPLAPVALRAAPSAPPQPAYLHPDYLGRTFITISGGRVAGEGYDRPGVPPVASNWRGNLDLRLSATCVQTTAVVRAACLALALIVVLGVLVLL